MLPPELPDVVPVVLLPLELPELLDPLVPPVELLPVLDVLATPGSGSSGRGGLVTGPQPTKKRRARVFVCMCMSTKYTQPAFQRN